MTDKIDLPTEYSVYDRSDKYTEIEAGGGPVSEEYRSLYNCIWRVRDDLKEFDRLMTKPDSGVLFTEGSYEHRYIVGTAVSTKYAVDKVYKTLGDFRVAQQSLGHPASDAQEYEIRRLRDVLHSQRLEVETCHKSLSIAIAKLNASPTTVSQTINVVATTDLSVTLDDADLSFLESRKRQHRRMRSRKPNLADDAMDEIRVEELLTDSPMLQQSQSPEAGADVQSQPVPAIQDATLYELPGDMEHNQKTPLVAETLDAMRQDYLAYRRHPSVLQISKEKSEARRSMIQLHRPPAASLQHAPSSFAARHTQPPIFFYTEPASIDLPASSASDKQASVPVTTEVPASIRASSQTGTPSPNSAIARKKSYKPQPLPPLPRYYALNPPGLSTDVAGLPSQQKQDTLPQLPVPVRHYTAPTSCSEMVPVQNRHDDEQASEVRTRRHTTASLSDGRTSSLASEPHSYSSPSRSTISLTSPVDVDNGNDIISPRYTSRRFIAAHPAVLPTDSIDPVIREDKISIDAVGTSKQHPYQQRPFSSLSVNDMDSYRHSASRPASVSSFSLLPEMVSVELLRQDSSSSKVVTDPNRSSWAFSPDSWLNTDRAKDPGIRVAPAQVNPNGGQDVRTSNPQASPATSARRQRDRRKALLQILEEVS